MTIQNQKRVGAFRSTRDSGDGVSESALQVNVVFTTVEETLAALRRAGQLAHGQGDGVVDDAERQEIRKTMGVPSHLPATGKT